MIKINSEIEESKVELPECCIMKGEFGYYLFTCVEQPNGADLYNALNLDGTGYYGRAKERTVKLGELLSSGFQIVKNPEITIKGEL